jgi:hypothetical protein
MKDAIKKKGGVRGKKRERERGRNFPSIKRGLRGVLPSLATCLSAEREVSV